MTTIQGSSNAVAGKAVEIFTVICDSRDHGDLTIIYNSNYFRGSGATLIKNQSCVVVVSDNKTATPSQKLPIEFLSWGDKNGTGEFIVIGKVHYSVPKDHIVSNVIIEDVKYPIEHDDSKHENSLTAVALIHNMNAYLEEWILHHLKLGFSRIVLYDNFTIDIKELHDIASKFPQVIIENWSYRKFLGSDEELRSVRTDAFKFHLYVPQSEQLNHALYKYRGTSSHITFIDIDEFIFGTLTLSDNLKSKTHYIMESYSFGCVPNIVPKPASETYPVVKSHLYRKPVTEGSHIRTKAIVDPCYLTLMGVHQPIISDCKATIERPSPTQLHINHYMFRCYNDRFYREAHLKECPHGDYDFYFDCPTLDKAQQLINSKNYEAAWSLLTDIPNYALRASHKLIYLDCRAQSGFYLDFEAGKKAQSELNILLDNPSASEYRDKHIKRIKCNNLFYFG
jgi:hypothetical protein